MVQKGQFQEVNVYDFPSLSKGKAIPYGAYDIIKNKGFVNVGVSSDTGEFAVESIRRWWQFNGKKIIQKQKILSVRILEEAMAIGINLGNIIYKNL